VDPRKALVATPATQPEQAQELQLVPHPQQVEPARPLLLLA